MWAEGACGSGNDAVGTARAWLLTMANAGSGDKSGRAATT